MTPDLFDDDPRYHARNTDPGTSHAAARQLRTAAHRARILATLAQIGKGTHEEIARASGLKTEQVWRRLSDLERLGQVRPTEEERLASTGRYQRVWVKA